MMLITYIVSQINQANNGIRESCCLIKDSYELVEFALSGVVVCLGGSACKASKCQEHLYFS